MSITRRLVILAAAACAAACASTPAPQPAPAWNAAALAEAIAYAQSQNTTGFLIIQNGETVAEHNWPLGEGSEQFEANFTYGRTADGVLLEDVASQQKSFIAILAGVAVDKGLLDVERPVSSIIGDGWSKASTTESRITVRNLLEMNSGLTEALEADAEPGEKFFYNTPAYAFMKPVLESVSGKPLDEITAEWLTEPAGMSDTAWRQRPAVFANVGNPTGLVTTPRDIAIMGQLVLDGGLAADGTRVISYNQLTAMFKPTATNPAYGRLWWLNGGDFYVLPAQSRQVDGSLIPTAPADLVAAQGAMDRKLYVVPSMNLVVARTGMAAEQGFNNELWRLLMAAAPN